MTQADPASSPFNPPVPMNPLQIAAMRMQQQMPQELPPPSQWERIRGKPYPKAFVDKAKEFIGYEMEASRRLIELKQDRWKLIRQMFLGEVGHHDLVKVLSDYSTNPDLIRNKRWQSDFLLSCAPIISSYADRMFGLLFSDLKKYWEVNLVPSKEASIEDNLKPTSEKIQSFITLKNTEWQFLPEMYRQIQESVAMGQQYGKIFYHRETKYIWRRAPGTGEMVEVPVIVEYPKCRMIPGDLILPDYAAENGDIQSWTGIGHRTWIPYALIVQRFNEGIYNLNRKEVERAFKESKRNDVSYTERIWADDDIAQVLDYSRASGGWLWEWHGKIPLEKGGFEEVISSSITVNHNDTAQSGIWVRLDRGPALPVSAGRPFFGVQFTPLPSPFGKGAVEANFDVIYYFSDILNQIIDNARLTVNAEWKTLAGSPTAQKIAAGQTGDIRKPGKIHIVNEMEDLHPIEPLPLNASANVQLLNIFKEQFDRTTNVSDNTLAMPNSTDRTAYEANQVRQMADVPLMSRLQLLVSTAFEPIGNTFIELLQANVDEPQQVSLPGPNNSDMLYDLPLPELRTGRYRVTATLGNADNMRIAKMQSVERVMPLILQVDQWAVPEGKTVDKFGILIDFLKMTDMDISRHVTDIPPEQKATLDMLKQLPPQLLQEFMQVPPEMLGQALQMVMQFLQEQMAMQQGPPGPQPGMQGGPGPGMMQQQPQPHDVTSRGTPLGTMDRSDFGGEVQNLQLESAARGGMQT